MNSHQVDQLRGYPWIEDEIKIFAHCDTILDIGCGTAWFAKALADAYPNVQLFGIDVLNAVKFSKLEFVLASATNLPFTSGSFHAVSCKAVLEHLSEPLQAIREINRVLKEDGIVFISVPDARSKSFWDDYTHVRPYTKKSMEAMLIDGGFEVQSSWYFGGFPGVGILLRSMKVRNQKILRALGKYRINRSVLNVVARKK
jgi:SAM-dependent methyltransferase